MTNFTRLLFKTKEDVQKYLKDHEDLFRRITYHYAQQQDGRWLLVFQMEQLELDFNIPLYKWCPYSCNPERSHLCEKIREVGSQIWIKLLEDVEPPDFATDSMILVPRWQVELNKL